MNIDRKYTIRAVNPCSRSTHDEHDSILFLAKDKAVPAMLRAYLKESEKLGANPAHLESIGLLIGRVEQYQREVEAKIPDTDLPCEIRRCVDGEGVSDNKQDFAPGAQPAPSEQPEFARKAWARFKNELHRSPDAPYPGMSEAFEQHFSQSFADREWRAESATWAAAWKAAKRHEAQEQPAQIAQGGIKK